MSNNRDNVNAAAMREALDFVSHMDDNGYTSYDVATAIEKARAALSAPARNCDVGTTEEQYKRFKKFCFDNMGDGMNEPRCSKCPLGRSKASCKFDWAQMPYEKGDTE